ncbi:MAG: hypothetical protein K6F33_05145 [Bacteroidales bacterium]|nr:hypothetical protein [Bacteroidales bacterium]
MENKDNDKDEVKVRIKKKYLVIGGIVLAMVLLVWIISSNSDSIANDVQRSANSGRNRHKHGKHARDYEVQFLDSMDKSMVRPIGAASNHKHWAGGAATHVGEAPGAPAVSNRLNAAYRLGMAFASIDGDAASHRERLIGMVVPTVDRSNADSLEQFFYDCVSKAEAEGENGIAALIMSGYYFGSLNTVLRCVDEDTQLPDEKTLAAGIKKMGNLKEYLNNALTAEKEVKTTMAIQRLEAAADSVETTYFNCQADYGENGPKYEKLSAAIQTIEDVFK